MKKRTGFTLCYGSFKNHWGEDDFATYNEMLAKAWAMRLCNHPELCWWSDMDGRHDNRHMTRDAYDKLDTRYADVREMKAMCDKLIKEDNDILSPDHGWEGTKTFEEGVSLLVEKAEGVIKYLPMSISNELEQAIWNMKEWMDGIAEENASPARRGWVASDGRP